MDRGYCDKPSCEAEAEIRRRISDGTQRRPCPDCRQATVWDEVHHPNAWRHVDTDSRWCSPQPGEEERGDLNYPTGCLQPPVPAAHP